jgi:alpha-1,3-rhamnosyl/mannosyltransferase
MRVAVDALPLLTPSTGLAQYTRELMRRVGRIPDIDLCFCYGLYWADELREGPLPYFDGLRRSARAAIPGARVLYGLVRQAVFSAGVRRRDIDLHHAPNFLPSRFSGPIVITVHDLSYLKYPQTHPPDRVRHLNRYLPSAIERASFVLVDSDFVRQEVLSHFAVPEEKVVTTYLGVSEDFRVMPPERTAAVLNKHGLARGGYILSVGTLEPRKNLRRTLEAYGNLPRATRNAFPLALAGMAGWGMEGVQQHLKALVRSGDVRLLGYVAPKELPLLYAGAAAFVYPSLYEGFGLPVLEALASGVPAVTSNRGSLVEIAGKAAITVEPEDSLAIQRGLEAALQIFVERDARIARGIAWARTFTWERCAEQTVEVYRRAVGGQ